MTRKSHISSPAQRAALDYGQNLRTIRGCCSQLKMLQYRLDIGIWDFSVIQDILETQAKKKFEAKKRELLEKLINKK